MKRIILAILLICVLGVGAFAESVVESMPAAPEETKEAAEEISVETAEEAIRGRLSGLIIGIDPGHQEHANSEKEKVSPTSKKTKPKVAAGTKGRATGTPEYVVDLNISLLLRDALVAEGATVYMTRETNDVNISNMERALMMNEYGCDLVLRIHCNGVNDKSAHGIGLYVNKTGAIAESSASAARAILPRMCEATGARKNGVYKRDIYTGLNWSTVPCILVECGYMTNYDEDLKLEDPAYQQLLVNGMVEGIADWFGRN